MVQGKQSEVMTKEQSAAMLSHLASGRNAVRDKAIFLLSVRAGLRAKEVAGVRWKMVMGSNGQVGDHIALTDDASMGRSGRLIPLNGELRKALEALLAETLRDGGVKGSVGPAHMIRTERAGGRSRGRC